jgi:hypothetical protein
MLTRNPLLKAPWFALLFLLGMSTSLSAQATQQLSYTLMVVTSGNGTVSSTDGFINCPGMCSHSYPSNTQVTLNAAPAQGWVFGGWDGPCVGTGSCTVTMTQPLSVGAIFSQALQLSTVTPCRLLDTRQSGPIQGGTFQNFNLPQLAQQQGCADLSAAAAYSLNVTVVPQGRLDYLPSGPPDSFSRWCPP